jgi:uncharacterized membrane protein YqjE
MFERLQRILATLVTLLHTRLELAAVELEDEVRRFAEILAWTLAGVLAGGFAVLLLALTVVIAFWDGHRLLAASLVTLVFAGFAVAAALVVRNRIRTRPPLLAATLGELKRDARALDGAE